MASVFLNAHQTGYVIANNGDSVYGQAGEESVVIREGVTGIVLDQNIEQVSLAGNVGDFAFQQQGNRLLVFQGGTLAVSIYVQDDDDGTVFTFDDGTWSAMFNDVSVIEMGGTPVPDDFPGAVVPADDDPGAFITVIVDTEPFPVSAVLSAEGGAYHFIDDASVASDVIINHFSADDVLSFTNADVSDYFFSNEGPDVILSCNFNDEGTINIIRLTGVVGNDALVYDRAGFADAAGFDPFISV